MSRHGRKGKAVEGSLVTGAALTLVFAFVWMRTGSWIWVFPMVFAGVLPTVESLRAIVGRKKSTRRMSEETRAQDERDVLRVAQAERGTVTPSLVAIETTLTTDRAQAVLDDMTKKGYATMNVREDGHIEYQFPEFLPDDRR